MKLVTLTVMMALFSFNAMAADEQPDLAVLSGSSVSTTGSQAEKDYVKTLDILAKSIKFECQTSRDGGQGACTVFAWTCNARKKLKFGLNLGYGNQNATLSDRVVVIDTNGNTSNDNEGSLFGGASLSYEKTWGGGGNIRVPLATFQAQQTYMAFLADPAKIQEDIRKRPDTVSATLELVTKLYGAFVAKANVNCDENGR